MTAILVSVATMLAAIFSSCEKERQLPPPPDEVDIIRYASDLSIPSDIIGGTVRYSIYLPADYNKNPDKRYPVVYLLHGLGDNYLSWNDKWLQVTSTIDNLETRGLEPMIYVMPDGYRTYYVNRFNGRYDYMDMFTDELMPYIDRTYRTIADRDHRAAVGYSMGGFGAFILPSANTDLFSVSVPLSMSFRTDAQYMTESPSGWNDQWGAIFGGEGTTGADRLTDYYKLHCPHYMFTEDTADDYSDIDYFLDCGDDEDQLLVANDDLHVVMRDLGMRHEYRVRNGAHTSDYWRSGMLEALPYIQKCFADESYPDEPNTQVAENHIARREEVNIAGIDCEVFLPEGYDASAGDSFPLILFAHGGSDELTADDVVKVLEDPATSSRFVMIAFAVGNAPDVRVLATEASELYRLSESRTGLGYKQGGALLYAESLVGKPVISSLFLLDGELPLDGIESPACEDMFYYISLADQGMNYKSANALYKFCHSRGISYEYRVFNGIDSKESALAGLTAMRDALRGKM